MKVCIISRSDGRGGAYAAAYRLHQALQRSGSDSIMIVGEKTRDEKTIWGEDTGFKREWTNLALLIDNIVLKTYPNRDRSIFSPQWVPDSIASKIAKIQPDIINLHWVCAGYLRIESLAKIAKLNKPIVWTLHDMWAFTGGCHYSQGCDRYINSCGACPHLHSSKNKDLSRWIWQRKAKSWQNINITIVTPSKWLAKCAKASSLFKEQRIEVIPNGIDTKIYRPIDKKQARELLQLPQDKHLILFGATAATSDRRKGFHLLQPALESLSKTAWKEKTELVVFGASESGDDTELGFKCNYLGQIGDDLSLALIYSAADVFVASSVEDNLPNTIVEAIACGTPSVAFNIGGIPDIIEHQQNGYLAEPYQTEDLAKGIAWVLENPERHKKLSYRARAKAEQEFTQEIQAHRYTSLYSEIKR
ncbi:glycosyltransferase family 4 protein [Aerosakkonema funiforme]|uniref:Glycosyltransferase family 4 protein n=1 Tax=Aerosakkonema funiforme FACHB-1375 TaxID=2949571 RepID=A0A926VEF9_9CYAN|nr:glycosyltransferase family 4 protein [Aerosakkonema funiforme]MBD2180974.1 glycosyltransferase family 4 protein [Aerosakkonema funiforme FACHB-1375]